jgi:hypothetical protein
MRMLSRHLRPEEKSIRGELYEIFLKLSFAAVALSWGSVTENRP